MTREDLNQLIGQVIDNKSVIEAFLQVDRADFVPLTHHHQAYEDHPLSIGYQQTISQPSLVAQMLEMACDGVERDRVLEIGTGSGYQTALLLELFDEVISLERIHTLYCQASRLLQQDRLTLAHQDGYFGAAEHAPYGAIVVTAAADHIPPSLIDQLEDQGNLVIPVQSAGTQQHLIHYKKNKQTLRLIRSIPVRFVPFLSGLDHSL